MRKMTELISEIISTWQRDQDGLQFCLRRDGRTFFRHGPDEKFLPDKGTRMTFEQAEKWAKDHSFFRTQKYTD